MIIDMCLSMKVWYVDESMNLYMRGWYMITKKCYMVWWWDVELRYWDDEIMRWDIRCLR